MKLFITLTVIVSTLLLECSAFQCNQADILVLVANTDTTSSRTFDDVCFLIFSVSEKKLNQSFQIRSFIASRVTPDLSVSQDGVHIAGIDFNKQVLLEQSFTLENYQYGSSGIYQKFSDWEYAPYGNNLYA